MKGKGYISPKIGSLWRLHYTPMQSDEIFLVIGHGIRNVPILLSDKGRITMFDLLDGDTNINGVIE